MYCVLFSRTFRLRFNDDLTLVVSSCSPDALRLPIGRFYFGRNQGRLGNGRGYQIPSSSYDSCIVSTYHLRRDSSGCLAALFLFFPIQKIMLTAEDCCSSIISLGSFNYISRKSSDRSTLSVSSFLYLCLRLQLTCDLVQTTVTVIPTH